MNTPMRSLRVLRATLAVLAAALSALFVVSALLLRGSLAAVEGEVVLPGLESSVVVARDEHGRPVITAASWHDLTRALGYLHAQERFFQMDLARRSAAGELAEVLGAGALQLDESRRLHRLRPLAVTRLASLAADKREILEAYAAGVNAGLSDLSARPFEYWLLGESPAPWRAEDLLLVVYAMYFQLTDEMASRDAMLTTLRDVYPQPYFAFLAQDGTTWDAPVLGAARSPMPVPGPDVYTLPRETGAELAGRYRHGERAFGRMPGSNNWALHGSRTESGVAMLANDMHLGLAIPNTWYQARLVLQSPGNDWPAVDITGVTLPGTFGVIVGSNGQVAWGFTNSYGDWSDRVLVEVDPDDASRYRVGDGFEAFANHDETIAVKGGDAVAVKYRWTRWGPVVGEDHQGRLHALKWLAHEPEAVNLKIIDLAGAKDVVSALRIANGIGAPPQNFVAADRNGNIGWTILGRVPRREGYDPRFASSWAEEGVGWQGWRDPGDYPRIVNPPGGQIWTANARVVDDEALSFVGDGGYDLGARAKQVRDGLGSLSVATESDMLNIQLDDRALFLERWRTRLLVVLDEAAVAGNPQRAALRKVVEDWTPRASVDSAGFRLVRAWRLFLRDEVFEKLTAEARAVAPSIRFNNNQWEGALWSLLEEKPHHLLPKKFASWDDWMLAMVDYTIEYFAQRYEGALSDRNWGERNIVRVDHPLSAFLPGVGRFLNMPAQALPGDRDMPLVQSPGFGASQRLGVSPGRESEGYMHMPGGQSGNPLSPYYDSQHNTWARGRPISFLPGPPQKTLTLIPES